MNWQVIRRETGLIEHVCEHGVGHPNSYSSFRIASAYGDEETVWSIHGCCAYQCCQREDFPGRRVSDLEIHERFMDRVGELLPKNFSKEKRAEIAKQLAFAMHDSTVNGITKYKNGERYW